MGLLITHCLSYMAASLLREQVGSFVRYLIDLQRVLQDIRLYHLVKR